MAGIQDVGTIGTWTPARLTRYIQNEFNQRQQTIKGTVSADQLFAHESLVFSSGDFTSADTTLARPSTGILTINNLPIATQSWVNSQGFVTASSSPVTSVFGRTGAVVATSGDYTAAQVTNAADKSSASSQDFAATVTSGAAPAFQATGVVGFQGTSGAGNTFLANYLLNGDTNPSFSIFGSGSLNWGAGGASATDTSWGRLAAGVVGSGGDAISSGPLNNGRSTVGGFMEGGQGRFLATQAAGGTNAAFASAIVGDTAWRISADLTSGIPALMFGGGVSSGDVGISRATTVPGSPTVALNVVGVPLVTNAKGYIYAAAANNLAFQSFLTTSDTNPAFTIFSQGTFEWGPGGASALDLKLARVTNSTGGTGTFLELQTGDGFGYGTGAGGSVTQPTSLSTNVTINKPSGKITLFTSLIPAGLVSSFVVANSVVGANDTIVLSFAGGDPNNRGLVPMVAGVGAGLFIVTHINVSGGSLASTTRTLNFTVIKGSAA